MHTQALLYSTLAVLTLLNVLVTRQLLRSAEIHKILFFLAVWLFPFLGALLVFMGTRSVPVAQYPIGGDQNPPGIGGL